MDPVQTKAMADFISEKVNSLSPSGIRKFFDLLSSLEGVISLGVGEPDFVTRGISGRRLPILWRRATPCIPRTTGCWSCAGR